MESRFIRHFVAAYDHGTFAAAAAELGLTQQAVSKSILRLEESIGARLFERDGRRLRPTAFADLLLPHARAIAAEAERFRAGLDDLMGGRGGTLRIGVGPSAATDLVSNAVARFAERRPDVRVKVEAGLFDDMADSLILGRLDLFIAIRQIDRPIPLIAQDTLREVDYVVVAGRSHPLAMKPNVSLEDLAAADWLVGTALGDIEGRFADTFRAAGIRPPKAKVETSSVLFALSMLQHGRHLMILPETLIAGARSAGDVAVIEVAHAPGWSRPLVVARRARAARVPAISNFLKLIGTA